MILSIDQNKKRNKNEWCNWVLLIEAQSDLNEIKFNSRKLKVFVKSYFILLII